MAKDPAFLMYYKDILTSCASWDADELGWFLRLLCHQADKPTGLENDIESLASLANVKFSQYERFKACWEQRLKGKFKATLEGLLINEKQEGVIDRRTEYSKIQRLSGTIGALIKKVKEYHTLTDEEVAKLSNYLENDNIVEKNKKEKIESLQAGLVALLGNVIANAIIHKIETKNESSQKSGNNGLPRKRVLPEGFAETTQTN